jgi:K+/H+ antiporter YhaU regulatory subunit KhtT
VVEIIDQTDRAIGDITQQVLRARGATIVTVVQADNWQPLPGDESPTP